MEKKLVTPTTWTMNAGAIIGLVMTGCDFLTYWSLKNSYSFGSIFSLITYVALIGGLYYSQKTYRDRTGGYIKYDKALIIGFLTSFYAAIVMGFYYFVINKFDPGMMDQLIQAASKAYENNSTILNQLNETREALTPAKLGVSIVFTYSIIGLMISLISSFIVKKIDTSGKEEEQNQTDN